VGDDLDYLSRVCKKYPSLQSDSPRPSRLNSLSSEADTVEETTGNTSPPNGTLETQMESDSMTESRSECVIS